MIRNIAFAQDASDEVIVIDDDWDVCDALASLVTGEGFRAATFTEGAEALRYLRAAAPPKVIFVDASMPGEDGWQVLEALKHLPTLVTTATFLMSSDTRLDEPRARDLGARGTLRKPFDLELLLGIVHDHCYPRPLS